MWPCTKKTKEPKLHVVYFSLRNGRSVVVNDVVSIAVNQNPDDLSIHSFEIEWAPGKDCLVIIPDMKDIMAILATPQAK